MGMSESQAGIFDTGLPRTPANHQPLTPLDFLAWSAAVFPDRTGVVYGDQSLTWGEVGRRCRRLASALRGLGVGPRRHRIGDVPEHAADAGGALRHPDGGRRAQCAQLPPRPRPIAFILEHGEAKVLLADTRVGADRPGGAGAGAAQADR